MCMRVPIVRPKRVQIPGCEPPGVDTKNWTQVFCKDRTHFFPPIIFIYLFYVNGSFVCMHVYVACAFLLPHRGKRKASGSLALELRQLWDPMWVQGIEPRSYGRTTTEQQRQLSSPWNGFDGADTHHHISKLTTRVDNERGMMNRLTILS